MSLDIMWYTALGWAQSLDPNTRILLAGLAVAVVVLGLHSLAMRG